MFVDDFEGDRLDTDVWYPYYLPHWSSRSASAATFDVSDSRLRLFLTAGTPLWCPATHATPLRVSGIASGARSGPVGSTDGPQRFNEGQLVAEHQPTFEGWLPRAGRVSIRCRMDLTPRSMAAMWLAGFQAEPDDSGELCVVEVFGRSIARDRQQQSAEIGVGVKQLGDPRLVHDFVTPRMPIDVAEFHEYAVEWDAATAAFFVDGEQVHATTTAPGYPMQVMLGVFDFPDWSDGTDGQHVPSLEIDWISGDERDTEPGNGLRPEQARLYRPRRRSVWRRSRLVGRPEPRSRTANNGWNGSRSGGGGL